MKKTQIYVLSLTTLPNDKHMAITAFMAAALNDYAIADTSLAIFVAAFLAAYDNENLAFKRIDRKELTKRLNEADQSRINALRVLRDSLKVFLYRPDQTQKALAERALDVIELYGGTAIYTQPVDARTGNITNLIEDFEDKLSEAMVALGLTADVEALKAANLYFLQCQMDRDKSDADHGKKAMADARTETDNAWRAVVESVNNTIAYGSDEDRAVLVPFAKYMNVEIDRYRIQNGQGVGGNWGGGSSEETDGEETIRFKTATFKFIGGDVIKRQVEVGTPLIAPDNTEGYQWKPEVPELMPTTNKTFTEVPIEIEQVTATFHFADHTEEDIRQAAGTPLTAPQNTTGYVWSPEVPAVMPAEDTAYYELPVENSESGGDTGGGSTGGGNTNPGGGYVPPSNGGGFD